MRPSLVFLVLFFLVSVAGGRFLFYDLAAIFETNTSKRFTSEADAGQARLLSAAKKIRERPRLPSTEMIGATSTILLNIPFISQAPLGNWTDPRLQSACEETSILMIMLWKKTQTLTPAKAEKEILRITEFEKEKYGYFYDTSIKDSAKIFHDYFGYENIEVKENISVKDIKSALQQGYAVIVPVNGRKLKNPFYTPPGPIQHMLVIRGFDFKTKEFITNDPGTRHGNGLRYKEVLLEAALQDYLTGNYEPILEKKTAMIVIK